MLSEEQIEQYYQSQYQYFIDKRNFCVRMADNRLAFYGLITNDGRLVAISENPMSIKALVGSNLLLIYTFFIDEFAKYPDDYNHIVEKNKCWHFVRTDNGWYKNIKIESEKELHDYILTSQKIASLDKMHNYIDHNRKQITQRLIGQDLVYTSKYLEAKEILEKQIENDEYLNYPFVSGYAETVGISLQESAQQIKLQYEVQSCYLADSESLRIKYTNIVRKEKNIENLKEILNSFYTEGHGYSSL